MARLVYLRLRGLLALVAPLVAQYDTQTLPFCVAEKSPLEARLVYLRLRRRGALVALLVAQNDNQTLTFCVVGRRTGRMPRSCDVRDTPEPADTAAPAQGTQKTMRKNCEVGSARVR